MDMSGNYTSILYKKSFAYYNPKTGESGEVKNDFYEGRYNILSFEFENDIYFIGGTAVHDTMTNSNQVIHRNCIEKLIFEKTAR